MKLTTKIIVGLSLFKVALHLYVNVFAGYGIFRDELYYLACAANPALGYVDQPPLSVLFLGLWTSVFGDSIFAIRLISALAGGLVVYIIGRITKALGGGNFAITVACLAFIISPINLGFMSIYSMNSLDILFWAMAYFVVVRIIQTKDPKFWIILGIVVGVGLLNKISMLWFGAGLVVALLLTPQRYWLGTKWPYLSGAIALALFSPFLIWNGLNDWAHIEFIQNASSEKYSGLSAWSFLSGQFLINHPTNFLLWTGGLVFLLMSNALKSYRVFGWIFLTTLVILSMNGNSKSEYLAAALPILFICGGIMLESWNWLNTRTFAKATVIVLMVGGLFIAPLAAPVLSEKSFVTYASILGLSGGNSEGKEEAELPQFYADMHGWEDHAKALAAAYHSLPESDKPNAAIFGSNYGRSGAVDYYSDELNTPKSIGSHNNYWLWGTRQYSGDIIITMSTDFERLSEIFDSVELYSEYSCQYCMPYENNQRVYICRGLKVSFEELWLEIKNYS